MSQNALSFLDDDLSDDDSFLKPKWDDNMDSYFSSQASDLDLDNYLSLSNPFPKTDESLLLYVSDDETEEEQEQQQIKEVGEEETKEEEEEQELEPFKQIVIAGVDLLVPLSSKEKENQLHFYCSVYRWKYGTEIGAYDSESEWSEVALGIINQFLLPTAPKPILNVMLDVTSDIHFSETMFDEILALATDTIILEHCPNSVSLLSDRDADDEPHNSNSNSNSMTFSFSREGSSGSAIVAGLPLVCDNRLVQLSFSVVGYDMVGKVPHYHLRICNDNEHLCTCHLRYSRLLKFHMKVSLLLSFLSFLFFFSYHLLFLFSSLLFSLLFFFSFFFFPLHFNPFPF
eukprot:TRINITY_DN8396_c0_g1_i2.p1 TRINITY_DN8396_c0_g1~~TRINITY_DN8396_c0_g1_i2.p1  ORF type:complete len:343 (-),score=59.22 TRINITY_DN8396_c0_g1_i2:57-1085(-)